MEKDLYKESDMGDANAFGADLRICCDCKHFRRKSTDPFCKKISNITEVNRRIDADKCEYYELKTE